MSATKTTWGDLWELFVLDQDAESYDQLDAIEAELRTAGRIQPLTHRSNDHGAFEEYWQTIADEYIARHGDPTTRKEQK